MRASLPLRGIGVYVPANDSDISGAGARCVIVIRKDRRDDLLLAMMEIRLAIVIVTVCPSDGEGQATRLGKHYVLWNSRVEAASSGLNEIAQRSTNMARRKRGAHNPTKAASDSNSHPPTSHLTQCSTTISPSSLSSLPLPSQSMASASAPSLPPVGQQHSSPAYPCSPYRYVHPA